MLSALKFIYIFAYLIEGVMSRIIAIANFFPYLTLAPVSINHRYAEIKMQELEIKYQATRLANLSPYLFHFFLEELLSVECYLNKAKFLSKANTLAI